MDLVSIFQAVQQVMESHRLEFNQVDDQNHNHGDHMVDIFRIAAQAAMDYSCDDLTANELSAVIDHAASILRHEPGNGSAQVYADGLASLADQIRKYQIGLSDLVSYTKEALTEGNDKPAVKTTIPTGVVLKALVAALAGWHYSENDKDKPARLVDLGYMFDLGISYMQAKQRGGTRAEVLADAAASVSPLSRVPYRYESGKVALGTLLRALAAQAYRSDIP